MNMNTRRIRIRRNCCHVKQKQNINDLQNSTHFPCGRKPNNDEHLIKHYKNYINRGLEHVSYLEKKSRIIQQRKGLGKKSIVVFNENFNNCNSNSSAFSTLSNF